jgi:hypothetical protein
LVWSCCGGGFDVYRLPSLAVWVETLFGHGDIAKLDGNFVGFLG